MENKAVSLLLRRLSAMRDDLTELRRRAEIAAHVMANCMERDLLREQLILLNERDKIAWERLVRNCAESEDPQTEGAHLKILCCIGIHKWETLAFTSFINPLPLEECSRCGMGQQNNVAGFTTRYTAQAIVEFKGEMKRQAVHSMTDNTEGKK